MDQEKPNTILNSRNKEEEGHHQKDFDQTQNVYPQKYAFYQLQDHQVQGHKKKEKNGRTKQKPDIITQNGTETREIYSLTTIVLRIEEIVDGHRQ